MASSNDNDLVLYHYNFSPYSKKLVWYLTLRKINYAECIQPPYLPRPDIDAIGLTYRRMPVLAHGRDIQCDTRQIQTYLDKTFPASDKHPGLAPTSPSDQAYAHLLEKWVVEGGIFTAAASALPGELPALRDPKFQADREKLTGRGWSADDQKRVRADGLVTMRDAFATLEEQILGDGREWVLGNDAGLTRADLDVIWPFMWLSSIPGALPEDTISSKHFPKTWAWFGRFQARIKQATASAAKPVTLKGEEATSKLLNSNFAAAEAGFDENDPTGLKQGQQVEANPTDWGSTYKEKGKLVGLNRSELVIEAEVPGAKGKTVRIHYPRVGFTVKAADAARL